VTRIAPSVVAVVVLGCSGKKQEPPPAVPAPVSDAGVDGITSIGGWDPSSGMHLDDDPRTGRAAAPRRNRQGRPIDITLKSTPTGAVAAVDGREIGRTPVYWLDGEADGQEHEFTFTLPRYATARYRFVPISSGVIHARLEPIDSEPADAGIRPSIAPVFAPDAAVAPPPTVLTPDAAVRVVAPDAAPAPSTGSDTPGVGPEP
jgi:hypothetical protein